MQAVITLVAYIAGLILGFIIGFCLCANTIKRTKIECKSRNKMRTPVCADNDWHCTFPECNCDKQRRTS